MTSQTKNLASVDIAPKPPAASFWGKLLFGDVAFQESDEYLEFQFKFLSVLMVLAAFFTLLFVAGAYTGANPMGMPHLGSMVVFTLAALSLWLVLRGNAQRFYLVAWLYEIICLLEYTSALMFVPEDELRILWFYLNVPGVYILLGQRAGMVISALTVVGLGLGNAYLSKPYSPNAIATALVSLSYLAVSFHVYGSRSISFFLRMREANRKLHQLATHDMLTGLLNARAYYQRCDAMINLAQRDHEPFAVLFVDLDHFKSVNDTHGHSAGDLVLKAVATCLAKGLRQSDLVGRIGGEEFSLFLPHTDLAGARQLAESIRKSIEQLMPDIGHMQLRMTASIGVADNSSGLQTMAAIQQCADASMYDAKAGGRNRVSCFENLLTKDAISGPVLQPL